VYCGASEDVRADYIVLAQRLGTQLAASGIRLVYGGGGVGLMGACAKSAHAAGGAVLGVMPRFLLEKECVFEEVEHVLVDDMHTRKMRMFEEADAFVVLPGGIGTLEEAVEVLSWARLGLHNKPVAFLDEDGFWTPFFDLMAHIIDGRFTPASFKSALVHSNSPLGAVESLLETVAQQCRGAA
jgi:uncharacterized protein (TIGR00730 family)